MNVTASACNVGDPGSIPGLGRSPGEGNGSPLQDSCLENPMDEEPGGLESTELHKSQTRLSDRTDINSTAWMKCTNHLKSINYHNA